MGPADHALGAIFRRTASGWTSTPPQIIGRYPGARSALLPLLHLVQAQDGYLSPAGIGYCADCSA